MKDIHFRVWYLPEKKMYFRGYQKWLAVLLCEDDKGQNAGKGVAVKRVKYNDCVLLESSGIYDKKGREIFEGDIVRVKAIDKEVIDTVGAIPDTFGVKIHPLKSVLDKHNIDGFAQNLEIEIVGNVYES